MTYEECKKLSIDYLKNNPTKRRVFILLGQGHLPRFILEFFCYNYIDGKSHELFVDCSEYIYNSASEKFVFRQNVDIEDEFTLNCSNIIVYSDKWIDITDYGQTTVGQFNKFMKKIYNNNDCYTKCEAFIYDNQDTFSFSEIDTNTII